LTAPAPPEGHSGAVYQWLRDAHPITGATSPTYTPTAADAGARLSVRLSATGPDGAVWAQTTSPVAVAKLAPKLSLVKLKNAKATIKVKVTGIPKPTGKVKLSIAGTTLTVKLKAAHKGKVTVKLPAKVLTKLARATGKTTIKITFTGAKQIAKKTTAITRAL
jgi:hypothetical protein